MLLFLTKHKIASALIGIFVLIAFIGGVGLINYYNTTPNIDLSTNNQIFRPATSLNIATKDQETTKEPETETTIEKNQPTEIHTELTNEDDDNVNDTQEDYDDNVNDTQEDYDEHNYDENYGEYKFDEIDIIARVVYLEAGSCSEYCQWLVGSTLLNLSDIRGGVYEVAFDNNMFSVSNQIYDCVPSEMSYEVANRVSSGDRDYNVMAFRAGYYHDFGTPYVNVDNVYFSTY